MGPSAESSVVPRAATQKVSMEPRTGSATMVAAQTPSWINVEALMAVFHPSWDGDTVTSGAVGPGTAASARRKTRRDGLCASRLQRTSPCPTATSWSLVL